MELQNDKVVVTTEEFLVNSLYTGLAFEALAKITNLEMTGWMGYLSDEADKKYKSMSPKQREEMLNAYAQLSAIRRS